MNDDVVDDDESLNTDREKPNPHQQLANHPTEHDEKLLGEIHSYEKRIQGLIEGVGMLKERVNSKQISAFSLVNSMLSLGASA